LLIWHFSDGEHKIAARAAGRTADAGKRAGAGIIPAGADALGGI